MLSRQPTTRLPRHAPRGITLLELLIVLTILLMVTAAAIPLMAPALENRQMREGSRMLSTYLSAARARAVQIGRPVGVILQRFNGQPFAFQMAQVEIPPPYAGDTFDSYMNLGITGSNPGNPNGPMTLMYFNQTYNQPTATLAARWYTAVANTGTFNHRLVRIGDEVQFNGQGYTYTIFGPDANGDGLLDDPPDDNSNGVVDDPIALDIAYLYPAGTSISHLAFPWDGPAVQPATYQVSRQPVRTSAQPVQLPEGIVIDLVSSGVGITGAFNSQPYTGSNNPSTPPPPIVNFDPVIVFSPAGRLDYVSVDPNGRLVRPTDTLYLLLGRRELMYDATAKGTGQDIVDQNLSAVTDLQAAGGVLPPPPAHFWVSVTPQTGQVNVTEVAANLQDHTTANVNHQQVINDALAQSRSLARQAQSVGGN